MFPQRQYTYEIAPSANVGDSLAIINTNLVSLDIALNNINSIFMDILINFANSVSSFDIISHGLSATKFLYSQAYGVVATLSSYWQNIHTPAEFTLIYNIDVSRWAPDATTGYLPTRNSVFSVPGKWFYHDPQAVVDLATKYSIGNGVDSSILKNVSASTIMCLDYLNRITTQNPIFPNQINTVAHIVLPIYNTLGSLNGVKAINIPEFFSSADRVMTASYYKPRTIIAGTIIEHFQLQQQNLSTVWVSVGRTITI